MEKFTHLEVVISANGLVRVYGNGGMLYEVQGDYVRTVTSLDPKLGPPSGEIAAKKT